MVRAADNPPEYEERLILFLDFLGFRDIVNETVKNPDRRAALLRAVGFLSSELMRDKETDIGKMVTQFSDSVVVSYPVTEISSVFTLVNDVALAVIELAYAGYLLRGGITVGKLIHTEEYLVGPAMIKAYEMESRKAKYPRVLIDPVVFKFARMYHAPQNSPADEVGYIRSLLTKDDDGEHFFDYVSWSSVVAEAGGEANLYDAYLASLGMLVGRGLRKKDVHVKEKYLWLHKRYIATIDEILSQPENSNWYRENLATVAMAGRLKRYTALAQNAERAVAAAAKEQKRKALPTPKKSRKSR